MARLLRELLDRNATHVADGSDRRLAGAADPHAPEVVSVCCSDARVSQEGMFAVDRPGWLFTPSTIGNQVWDVVDGERVVDGSVLYPLLHTGTRTAVVVGHTGCGAVTAAVRAHRGDPAEHPAGIAKRVDLLVPVVADLLDRGGLDPDEDEATMVDAVVEANVRVQAAFLADAPEVPAEVDVYGFVYDLTGAYGGPRGRAYLVWANGVTDPDRLTELVGEERRDTVRSLLRPGDRAR